MLDEIHSRIDEILAEDGLDFVEILRSLEGFYLVES
jgi:hypothetical protein